MEVPILLVDGVNKHFGGLVAVRDLSFGVQAGEVVGLMGPNGAGKTTLINVIAGEYKPDSGIVKFKGNDITGLPPHKICHLGIARTYQIPQPFAKLTALQNIAVAAIYGRGLSKSAAEGEAAEIIDIVRLSEKKDMPAGDLEEISLKRLELARVLATNPTLLMIDEVAAGLTEAEIPQVLDILREIHEMGITIILIEHVMKVMMKAVGRIIVMDEGMKIADGTPNEVMDNKKVIEAYFGSYIDRYDSK
ncbi:MAG: ABC transporter ATP-binding protein [Deltaproteobacteria bacterium]|nr:MAG: ABC transporter ATP-binding protein [Deltaproteobacteria bacterium]